MIITELAAAVAILIVAMIKDPRDLPCHFPGKSVQLAYFTDAQSSSLIRNALISLPLFTLIWLNVNWCPFPPPPALLLSSL